MDCKLPERPEFSNKGTFGKVLNIAGSEYYTGAAYLSSISALKIGCGYVALSSCPKALSTVASISPDIVYIPISDVKNSLEKFDVVSIGCGLSVEPGTAILFKSLISDLSLTSKTILIDADGLNIMAKKKPARLPKNLIITPHPMEASRLLKTDVEKILEKPVDYAKKLSEKYSCTTVLKLHSTVVCSKDMEIYINDTGNSALSKAGAGDVLTGIISGLCAQGMTPFEAAKLGVYLHGRTGEIASSMLTEYSVLASDLLKYIHIDIVVLIGKSA